MPGKIKHHPPPSGPCRNRSGLPIDHSRAIAEEHWSLGGNSGVVVASVIDRALGSAIPYSKLTVLAKISAIPYQNGNIPALSVALLSSTATDLFYACSVLEAICNRPIPSFNVAS